MLALSSELFLESMQFCNYIYNYLICDFNYFCSCCPTEWPFYYVPFLVVYIFNWTMFCFTIASLCKHARKTNQLMERSSADKRQEFKKIFIVSLSLAVLLGFGWGFGLAVTSSDLVEFTFTFQLIFSIFVGFQGSLIFLLHGARNEGFRTFWLRLGKRKAKKPAFSKFTKDSGMDSELTGACTLSISQQMSERSKYITQVEPCQMVMKQITRLNS